MEMAEPGVEPRCFRCQSKCCNSSATEADHVSKECGCLDETLPSLTGVDLPPCHSTDHFPVTCSHHVDDRCVEALLVQYGRIRCARSFTFYISVIEGVPKGLVINQITFIEL